MTFKQPKVISAHFLAVSEIKSCQTLLLVSFLPVNAIVRHNHLDCELQLEENRKITV